ncbi:MAG: glutamine-hydrolyzing GMP synthase [Clostridia bacterium]|nr:glutamine-hydrolyzing GMP synthase [Clostridia bacterium]
MEACLRPGGKRKIKKLRIYGRFRIMEVTDAVKAMETMESEEKKNKMKAAIAVRPDDFQRITTTELAEKFIAEQVEEIVRTVGDKRVLIALSGGVDSSVVAALLYKAIGNKLACVHVNHGLMRKGESEQVEETFRKNMDIEFVLVDAVERFLSKLAGVEDSAQKRKIIGGEFIRVFEEEGNRLGGFEFLAQGTIYPDILESGDPNPDSRKPDIKLHHNVGGLPEEIDFQLLEPIKLLFKDEVRLVGKVLGLPDEMVNRQPFPGPGLGVRCTGAITADRLEAVRESDAILREEFAKHGLDKKVWQYFTVVPDCKSVGVSDGARTFAYPVIIRAVNSVDAMTATIEEIPYELLHHITKRITTEVKNVNRVLLDLTPKPCGTIEWE